MFDVPFLVLVAAFIIVLYITSRRHRERMAMIKNGVKPSLFAEVPVLRSGSKSLFFGLLGAAAGCAFLLSSFFMRSHGDREGMIIAGTLFFFSGGAMLLYWKLTAKDREQERRIREEYLAKSAILPVKEAEKKEVSAEDETG